VRRRAAAGERTLSTRRWLERTFASLGNHNYRRFFLGQLVSLVGTWMQTVALSWLVLQLSGSATMIGLVLAVQTLPVLVLAPYGGLVADRFDKRRVLLGTQSALALLALVLGVLVLSHTVRLWMVFLIALGIGLVNSVDNPTRQSFVPEMVGADAVSNAISLNSVMSSTARAIGPAIAGVFIVAVGVGGCFLLNAASFVAVLVALGGMNPKLLVRTGGVVYARGQIAEGFRYVRRTPRLLIPLAMMAVIGAFSYEFQVVLPVLAEHTFHKSAAGYGFFTAAFGFGSVIGGLVVASRRAKGLRAVTLAAGAFGATMLGAALAPTFALELAALGLVGAASVSFMARGNTVIQLTAEDSMRGRVMALWAIAFTGTTPFGGPIIGYVAEHASPRWGLAVGGFAALMATTLFLIPHFRQTSPRHRASAETHQLPLGVGPS
jgi:MFS family permease